MPAIPIQNETEYTLTAAMIEQITRDAEEYFGVAVRLIRVQADIERHAFNARTGEMRYAFSPGDFGLVDISSIRAPEFYAPPPEFSAVADETDAELEGITFDDDEEEEEEEEEDAPFVHLENGLHDIEEEDEEADFQHLDEDSEEFDGEDSGFLYDEGEEEDYD